jgi:hypothetical protein
MLVPAVFQVFCLPDVNGLVIALDGIDVPSGLGFSFWGWMFGWHLSNFITLTLTNLYFPA